MTNSFLIRDIEIFDGSGKPPFRGDVAVKNGRIAAIAQPQSIPSSGMTVYDGKDYSLAPGFIDAHGHSELDILDIPSGDNKISQGFTSEIAGNCGFTEFMEKGMSFRDFAEETEQKKIALNIAVMTGHNSLRTIVMGNQNRAPSTAELNEMERILRLTLTEMLCC
jgi:N-acyl-D-amino-acid deacylase